MARRHDEHERGVRPSGSHRPSVEVTTSRGNRYNVDRGFLEFRSVQRAFQRHPEIEAAGFITWKDARGRTHHGLSVTGEGYTRTFRLRGRDVERAKDYVRLRSMRHEQETGRVISIWETR